MAYLLFSTDRCHCYYYELNHNSAARSMLLCLTLDLMKLQIHWKKPGGKKKTPLFCKSANKYLDFFFSYVWANLIHWKELINASSGHFECKVLQAGKKGTWWLSCMASFLKPLIINPALLLTFSDSLEQRWEYNRRSDASPSLSASIRSFSAAEWVNLGRLFLYVRKQSLRKN